MTLAKSRAGIREWIGLAVLCLPCVVYVMDLSVLHLAVPSMTRQLEPTPVQLLWIVDIYGFLLAGFLVTMGNLGDRIGRRKLLMFGAGAFGVASLLAAFANSPALLIAARALLGIAGATLGPSTLSLISNMFRDEHQRTRAISIWGASFAAGGLIGPLVGGLLLQTFWWGSVFLIALPVMVLVLIAGPKLLPEFKDPRPHPLDGASVVLSILSVFSIIYGLKQIAQDGPALIPALFIVAGLALGITFIRRQAVIGDPLVDLQLFKSPIFTSTLIAFLLSGFVMYSLTFYLGQYFQLVLGLTPLQAGLAMAPSTAAVIASSLYSPNLTRYFKIPSILIASLALTSAGMLMLSISALHSVPYHILALTVVSIGMGPLSTLASALIVGSAPPARAGAAGSLSETSAEFGGALGLAFLGSIGVAVYRWSVSRALPAGISPDAANAARQTLAEAINVAGQLPAGTGVAIIAASRDAFTSALVVVAVINAALMFGAALMLAAAAAKEHPVGLRAGETNNSTRQTAT